MITGSIPLTDGLRGGGQLEQDLGLLLEVVSDLVERLLGQRQGRSRVVAVVANPGEEQQGLGAEGAGRSGLHRFLEERGGLAQIRSFEGVLAGVNRSMDLSFCSVRRRQRAGERRQLGG